MDVGSSSDPLASFVKVKVEMEDGPTEVNDEWQLSHTKLKDEPIDDPYVLSTAIKVEPDNETQLLCGGLKVEPDDSLPTFTEMKVEFDDVPLFTEPDDGLPLFTKLNDNLPLLTELKAEPRNSSPMSTKLYENFPPSSPVDKAEQNNKRSASPVYNIKLLVLSEPIKKSSVVDQERHNQSPVPDDPVRREIPTELTKWRLLPVRSESDSNTCASTTEKNLEMCGDTQSSMTESSRGSFDRKRSSDDSSTEPVVKKFLVCRILSVGGETLRSNTFKNNEQILYRNVRQRNNESSRRCRLKRKMRNDAINREFGELVEKNAQLKMQIKRLEGFVMKLRKVFTPINIKSNS